jgi:hypothetical protein
MTSTATGSPTRLAPGPLLDAWGTAASGGAPAAVLAHPDHALHAPVTCGQSGRLERVRELDDPMLTSVWGDRLTRLELELPGTAEGSVLVRVEVRA